MKNYLTTLYSRPGNARSSLMIDCINQEIDSNKKVLFLSLNLTSELINNRIKNTQNILISFDKEINIKQLIDNYNPDVVYIDYIQLINNWESTIEEIVNYTNDKSIKIVISYLIENIDNTSKLQEYIKNLSIYSLSSQNKII